MAVSEQVIIEVLGRVDSLEREMRRAGQTTDRQLSGIESRVRKFAGTLSGLFAGVSAAVLVSEFLQLADASKTIDAQLRLATAGFGTFAKAQEDARRIAADTRSGLTETTALYGNFARAGKDLGATQDDVARATETFSKTLKISGADANQAASATLQFGQALASGALRGDELNSVLEAAPRLATLLTESMGKSKGEIKALGEAGQLTSDKLLNALTNKKFTDGIDSEFRELPVTFGDAMSQVENAAIITFGAFDRGGQFSTALANFITDGSDGFKELEQDAVDMGIAVRANIEGLVGAFGPIFDEAKRFFEFVNGQSAQIDIGRDIDKSLGDIDRFTKWLSGDTAIEKFVNKAITGNESIATDFQGRYRRGRDAADLRGRRDNGRALPGASAAFSMLDRARKAGEQALAPKSSPAAKKTGGASAANKAAAEARKAEQERLRAIRDDAASARDSAQLQDDINAAKAALATATEDVLRFQLDAIESERKQQVDDIETQVKLGKLGREEADRRILVNSELAGLRGELVKRRAAEAKEAMQAAQYRSEASTLQAEAQLIDARKARRDVELRILDYAYKEEELAIRRQAANGEITNLDEELAKMRRRRVAETESTNRASEGPLSRYRRDLNNPDRANDEVENAVIDQLEGVRDSITSAVQKTLGIKNPILAALINSFIEQQLIKPFLNGFGGGGGGILSSIGGLIGIKIPGFAKGTNFAPGGPALVGEDGPEIVDLPRGARVIPNDQLNARAAASMTGLAAASTTRIVQPIVQQTVHVDARNSVNPAGFAQQILAAAGQQAQQVAGAMGQNILKAVPGRIATFQRDGT